VKKRFSSRLSRAQGAAYQGATEAVLAVPIAVGLGYWADTYFGTSPRYLFVGAVIGFGAMVLRLARMRPDADPGAVDEGASRESALDEGASKHEQHAEADPETAAQNGTTKSTREE
jgi:F0F1-type ATP synthase assembly protein I